MKSVAYYRVSTRGQDVIALSLDAQRAAVLAHLGGAPLAEFTEMESRWSDDRPQLEAALSYAKLTGSTLVVAKLDRLSRNAAFLNALFDGGQPVVFADMPDADRFTLGIMARLAQWEREQASRRTKEALAAAKAGGQKLGGKGDNLASVSAEGRRRSLEVRRARAAERRRDIMPHVEAARTAGARSYKQIAEYLNGLSITTPKGGLWYSASVGRLLA